MADELTDSYRILQLEPGAALPQIKRSYRNLVKTWHPDHFAPGSAMEIKAQEKLKEINQAYERLCKNRGAEASADPDATGEAKKARKPAASDDDEKATPKRANSRKAEEEPMADSAAKPRGRKVGDLDDEAAEMGGSATGAQRQPGRPLKLRWLDFWQKRSNRRWAFAGAAFAAVSFAFAHFSMASRIRDWLEPEGVPPPAQSGAAAPSALNQNSAPAGVLKGQVPGAADTKSADDPGAPTVPAVQTSLAGPAANSSASAPIPFGSPPSATGATAAATVIVPTRGVPAASGARSASAAGSPGPEVSGPAATNASLPDSPHATLDPSVAASSEDIATPTISEAFLAQRFEVFTVGSTKDEVVAVQGPPDAFSDSDFQYGSSHVTFEDGRVVSWQDGNPKLKARKPIDRRLLGTDYFTVGSRKDEVVAVQGKPDRYTDNTYQYGTSAVFFRDGRVVSWVDGSPRLNARAIVTVPSAHLKTFSVGSRKDEVVVAQGLPDTATETTFTYGTSTVFFTDGRVTSWVSGSPSLRAKNP